MSIIDFKTRQKITRAEQIARLNPELSRDEIARQLGIKPEIILMEIKKQASIADWIIFLATFAVMGALIGWGLTI